MARPEVAAMLAGMAWLEVGPARDPDANDLEKIAARSFPEHGGTLALVIACDEVAKSVAFVRVCRRNRRADGGGCERGRKRVVLRDRTWTNRG